MYAKTKRQLDKEVVRLKKEAAQTVADLRPISFVKESLWSKIKKWIELHLNHPFDY